MRMPRTDADAATAAARIRCTDPICGVAVAR
jgi:hypothetical protein